MINRKQKKNETQMKQYQFCMDNKYQININDNYA